MNNTNTSTSVQPTASSHEGLLDANTQEMMKAGVHYGHRTSRTHPKMKPFIAGVKNNIEIIDLEATRDQLERAATFLKSLPKDALILFVGTLPPSQSIVREVAEELGCLSVTERWLGGLLTNFKMVSGRIKNMIDLKKKRLAGEFEKYTKKEQQVINHEIQRAERVFSGHDALVRIPDALIVVGVTPHMTAINEARIKKVPIIALVDTDASPILIDYPIAANDNARSSIAYILSKLAAAIKEGRGTEKAS